MMKGQKVAREAERAWLTFVPATTLNKARQTPRADSVVFSIFLLATRTALTTTMASGALDIAFYQAPDTIAQFEHIKDDLTRDLQSASEGSASVSGQELALFVHALQKFQQDVLGPHASLDQSSVPTRIPAKLFRSTPITPSSSLYKILLASYEYRHQHGWSDWDLSDQSRRSQYLDMVAHIRDALVSSGLLRNPSVFFAESVSEDDRERLSVSIQNLGGTCVSCSIRSVPYLAFFLPI